MNQNQAPAITPEHLDALRAFVVTLHDEIHNDTSGPAARRALRLLFSTLAHGSFGYLSASLRAGAGLTLAGDDRRWWLLLQIANAYKDHPDFPECIRPFLNAPEWQ